jgi:hypothetical protein
MSVGSARSYEIACAIEKLLARGYDRAKAEGIALQQQSVRVPGNRQQAPWDGKHASVEDARSSDDLRKIWAAIAKRERRAARVS